MLCPDCLSSDCAFNAATNTRCDSKFVNLAAGSHRTNSIYDNTLRALLPQSSSDISNSLIDSLLRYQQQGLERPDETPESVLLYNDGGVLVGTQNPWHHGIDGSDGDVMYRLFIIFCHHVPARNDINNLLGKLRFTAGTAPQKSDAAALHTMCADRVTAELAHAKLKPKSASELEDRTIPLAKLYQHIVKYHMASDVANLTKLTEGKFNVETGDRITEFENIKHISTPLQLMLILRDFEQSVFAIGKNGGKSAWEPFLTSMFNLLEGNDADFVHLFIYQSLNDKPLYFLILVIILSSSCRYGLSAVSRCPPGRRASRFV